MAKYNKFYDGVLDTLEAPVKWFRENVVEPRQQQYPWYHRQFRRVPEIDQCYTDDASCIYEADQQFKRDMDVEMNIVNILMRRKDHCYQYEGEYDKVQKCAPLMEEFRQAQDDFFIKYGDLGYNINVARAFMKQKHRLIWERRHGPVGSKAPKEE